MKERVLVAGFATRHVAQSAHRAGYEVYAVDHFCDQDLRWYTKDCCTFDELAELYDRVIDMADRHSVDMLVVTSGAETIGTTIPLCGTPPAKVERYLDKMEIQRFFEELKVPVPPLAAEGAYPAMLKPRRGAGGWRNAVVRSGEERRRWEEAFPDAPYIAQQVVDGMPASVSCIADGTRALAIATNEQLLRGKSAYAHGFAGSITPAGHPLADRMARIAEEIVAASGCLGSVGVDFMLGSDAWAIEINPRFQATLDTVEMATGMSVFRPARRRLPRTASRTDAGTETRLCPAHPLRRAGLCDPRRSCGSCPRRRGYPLAGNGGGGGAGDRERLRMGEQSRRRSSDARYTYYNRPQIYGAWLALLIC